MNDHWMISFTVGLCPKVVFKDGKFIFTEEEARGYLKELRINHPKVDFHISKNGRVQKDNETNNN